MNIDRSVIARLELLDHGGETNLVGRLVDMYLNNVDSEVARLRECIVLGNSEIPLVAHALKSAHANIGAVRVVRILEDIENRTTDALEESMKQVESEVSRFRVEVSRYATAARSQ